MSNGEFAEQWGRIVKTYEESMRHVCKLWRLKITDEEQPYNTVMVPRTVRMYNPLYGDNRICECGHPYYRHFDQFEHVDVQDVGCKYCECWTFIEEKGDGHN